MATKATTKKTAAKKTAAKKAPAKAKATAAKPKAAKATEAEATEEPTFGVSDVALIIQERTGNVVKNRDLRTLLRKMAKDGRLQREIIPGNRTPWVFDGPEDPQVEQIVEAYEAGELEADKKEKLDALKARKAEERAAKKAAEEAEAEGVDDEEVEED